MGRTPFPGAITRLRVECDNPCLFIDYNEEVSLAQQTAVWNIWNSFYGTPVCVYQWRGSLDGNLGYIASIIRRLDFRYNEGKKAYMRGIEQRERQASERRWKDYRNTVEGWAKYSERAFKALLNNESCPGSTITGARKY